VEFASVIAAPLGTSMLADLGARVIRVEPMEGDSFRHLRPEGVMAVKTTAGKESICIDLKREEGRSVARQLVSRADVLVHNYRPGVPERLGIGEDELRARHPRLIWVSVNGYGPLGPSAHRPATHPVAGAAMGGAGYQAGPALRRSVEGTMDLDELRETSRQLMRANEPSPDPNTSVIVASATLLALVARERLGVAQSVWVDMLRANAHANFDAFLASAAGAELAPRTALDDELLGTGTACRLYRSADGWVFAAAPTERERSRLCDAVALPVGDLNVETLARVLRARTTSEWELVAAQQRVAIVRADLACGPFFVHDGQAEVTELAPFADHAHFGRTRRWGPIVRVDGGASAYGPGVLAGEHTDRLLAELGHSDGERERLHADGVVAVGTV
jgi:crotonobetainyl-CoA:carnitine CoA-transferase CaiB-like acyl-CoA transferase